MQPDEAVAAAKVELTQAMTMATLNLLETLKRAEPAVWILATTGHPDAVAIHRECVAAIARWEPR